MSGAQAESIVSGAQTRWNRGAFNPTLDLHQGWGVLFSASENFNFGGMILNSNKKQTIFAVYFPQYFVVVLARRQDSEDDNAVMRNFTRQMLKDFIRE